MIKFRMDAHVREVLQLNSKRLLSDFLILKPRGIYKAGNYRCF